MTAHDASRQINYQDHSPSGKRIGKNQMDDYIQTGGGGPEAPGPGPADPRITGT